MYWAERGFEPAQTLPNAEKADGLSPCAVPASRDGHVTCPQYASKNLCNILITLIFFFQKNRSGQKFKSQK